VTKHVVSSEALPVQTVAESNTGLVSTTVQYKFGRVSESLLPKRIAGSCVRENDMPSKMARCRMYVCGVER
jgi:hypothetical protein